MRPRFAKLDQCFNASALQDTSRCETVTDKLTRPGDDGAWKLHCLIGDELRGDDWTGRWEGGKEGATEKGDRKGLILGGTQSMMIGLGRQV